MIYRFERQGRRFSTIAAVAGIWAGLIAIWIGLDAAIWILLIIAAGTLPAVWDIVRNTKTSVEVWPGRVVWRSALVDGDRADIDHVRLNRRFDGGMKITLVHVGGKHTRIPPDVSPPVDAFEAALKDAGIAVERHPFSPF